MLGSDCIHLQEGHPLNRMITTMTAQVKLQASDADAFVSAAAVYAAVDDEAVPFGKLRRDATARGVFKNARKLRTSVSSARTTRNVSVKLFGNLMLHITGCHSCDMLRTVIQRVCDAIRDRCGVAMSVVPHLSKLTMVNYAYALPGRVNLTALSAHLSRYTLVIFDPAKYAGANIKWTVDGTQCTILVFESGKAIIPTPHCVDRDHVLTGIIAFIETRITRHWERVRMDWG